MRWFNRFVNAGNFINYFGGGLKGFLADHIGHPASPTLYEAAAPWGWTASVDANYKRGANVSGDSGLAMGLAKIKYDWWVSRWIFSLPIVRNWLAPTFAQAQDVTFDIMTAQLSARPKVHWCVFGSTDSCMHVRGLGLEYEEALTHIDTLIGRYRALSRELGTEAERVYAILTDHGGVNVTKNLDISAVLSATGVRAYQGKSAASDKTLSRPIEALADTDACVLINGDTMAHVYLRNPHGGRVGGWHERVDSALLSKFPVGSSRHVDVITVLLNTAGVELVVTWLHVAREVVVRHSKGGMAIIAIDRGGALAYQVRGDVDPMRYDACGAAALVGRAPHPLQYHSAATWLNRTAECEFPYGVVRLYQLMSTPQGSDVVLTALAGYDFGKDFEKYIGNFRGGHGGARADQISVPYIFAGPGVRAGVRRTTARAEDVGATLMHLLTEGRVPAVKARFVAGAPDPLSDPSVDADLWRGKLLRDVLNPTESSGTGG